VAATPGAKCIVTCDAALPCSQITRDCAPALARHLQQSDAQRFARHKHRGGIMGEKTDLSWAESIEKIRHIAQGEVAMMHTFDGRKVGIVRPMATAGVDEDGTLWFLSPRASFKNEQLDTDDVMQLTYAIKSRSEYLVLDGRGSVVRDQDKIDQLWSGIDKTWFPEGKNDPSISLIRFIPEVGHYWDTKHSKMVQLLGMAVGAVTGKPTDDSVEGDVQL
jgi:general stress protein 26